MFIMTVTSTDIGQCLVKIRQAQGLTQVELARRLGLSKRTLCSYEKGDRRLPTPLVKDLCTILGVSADELLGIEQLKKDGRSAEVRIQKRLNQITSLPEEDRKMVLDMVDLLLKKNTESQ
jgi:transcriptional regulator with XRE-family HTH domain